MSRPVTILVVDDRSENITAMRSILDDPAWRVISAASGNEALQLLLEEEVALVLLDVQMPDMNGFETAEWMRAHPRTRRIPIIFVTAISREPAYLFKGYEAGAVDYILKPIDPVIVRSKVRVFAELARQRQELESSREELFRLNRELSARNRALQDELRLAREVQLGFLPAVFPRSDRLLFARSYQICSTLGGDLFDAFAIGERYVGVYIADVAGHGVSAALVAGLVKMGFDSIRTDQMPSAQADMAIRPELALGHLNRILSEKLPIECFVTAQHAVLDLDQNRIRIASAGHPPPLMLKASGQYADYVELTNGPALGLDPAGEYPAHELALSPDDTLLLYTDGITEAWGEQGEYGADRLRHTFVRMAVEPVERLIEGIAGDVDRHRAGAPISDDCSLLALRLRPAG